MAEKTTSRAATFIDRFQARVTRRDLARSGGVLGAGALLSQIGLLKAAAQDSNDVKDVIDSAMTMEAFAVTFLGIARSRAGAMKMSSDVNSFIRAAQCEEDAHYHVMAAAGAVSVADKFTINSKIFSAQSRFLQTLQTIEEMSVGLYMAGTRQFASAGHLDLVEIGYQIGATEAQHLAMTRLYYGDSLPVDRAFAEWQFRSASDAIQAMTDAGFIGGKDHGYSYPGPLDRNCRGVSGLVPETTDDQPAPAPTPGEAPSGATPNSSLAG